MNDTREQLERSIDRFLGSWTGWSVSIKVLREAIIGWLDRQAAITERECIDKRIADQIGNMWESRKIAELQAKLNYLEGHGVEIVDAVAGGYEVYNEWHRKADELQAKLDKARNEREMYRECFGKSVDKADEIRAIMAGMGMK